MRVGIIVTNHGQHSPEKLAAACADQILNIDPTNMDGDRVLEARRLELSIIEALVPHCAEVRDRTKSELHDNPRAHFARTDLHHAANEKLDHAVSAIQAAAASTEWAKQFSDPETVVQIRHRVGQFLVDTAHLERLYYRDRHPDNHMARRYAENPTDLPVKDEEQ